MPRNNDRFSEIVRGLDPEIPPELALAPEVKMLLDDERVRGIVYRDQDDPFAGVDPVGKISDSLGVLRHHAQAAYDILCQQKLAYPGLSKNPVTRQEEHSSAELPDIKERIYQAVADPRVVKAFHQALLRNGSLVWIHYQQFQQLLESDPYTMDSHQVNLVFSLLREIRSERANLYE